MKTREELNKVEDMLVKFENIGDEVFGKLLSKEHGSTFGNEVYKILKENGEVVTVFSTKVMESKMVSVSVGDTVLIQLVGTKPSTKKGQNDTMLFDVSSA